MLLSALSGCGGAPKAREVSATSSDTGEQPSRKKETPAEQEESEPESAPASSCTDGTCFACGSGYCPTGWYCDEAAQGGAACAWLPACNGKNLCACLEQTLGAGCSCDESAGGPHVTCK